MTTSTVLKPRPKENLVIKRCYNCDRLLAGNKQFCSKECKEEYLDDFNFSG